VGALASVVRALDVVKVVWIDDMFAIAPPINIASNINLAMEVVKQEKLEALGLHEFSLDDPDIDGIVERFGADEELAKRARALVFLADDVSRARSMMQEMDCAFEERTGAGWQTILKQQPAYSKTLFLLDRNFGGEQISNEDSDAMLRKTFDELILKEPSNYCVVLTKEVEAKKESEGRSELLTHILKKQLDDEHVIRFSVVSKSNGGADADSLSRSLRGKLAGVVLYSMLKSVVNSLYRSVGTIRQILSTEFPDVNKSVLQSSYEQGESEIEVLLRILQQNHRLELAKELQSADPAGLPALLKRFRLFQLDAAEVDDEHEVSGELKRINRAEIISDGTFVNGMLVPIIPGDVFVTATAQKPTPQTIAAWSGELSENTDYWMLLGQLCDIVTRKNGSSNTNMGFLAPFNVMKRKDKIDPKQLESGRMYALAVGEQRLKFDFRGVLSANLTALRLCSFNKDGMAYLEESDHEEVWSLASLAKAKKNALELFARQPQPEWLERFAIGFESNDATKKLKIDQGAEGRVFSYPIRRVCRIRDIEANDALAALERYWRRPAKPHEYV
jgi:hypothetical protein